ncbi:SusD-like starch-binding protein associating with outer membrane [Mucilaginibacter gracilis]|uniref:SusD-like starch-binding protein associating with outer membrane n=1 Tax=Mucilaginibacter gracilis TaxID=423350 RepID=A0A495J3C6_9SPHI|nr:RagB/SusD family nutrient uptake outer membrane protein [Mucilaginibacter gracilis]RKR83333.1 SusD-like starch-binding protein associating with outer membrane [Mucilaginibacter gracilis]
MKKISITLSFIIILFTACTKGYLDIKPDKSLVVPQTLKDFQALLDNTDVMNINMPSLQEISSDDYYIKDASYQSVTVAMYKNSYTWNKDIYAGSPDVSDWNYRYRQIFYANIVLEGLDKLGASEQADPQFAAEKGSALFYRAFSLFQVAQLFCKPYSSTASTDPGVPVRTESDINQVSARGTVAETYAQIITDIKSSINLLPPTVSVKTRPNQTAAFGLLARVYLAMGDYSGALTNADAGLKQYPTLLNYNNLSKTASFPFQRYNDEVIFHSTMLSTSMSNVSRLIIDTILYKTYKTNDLRLQLFFRVSSGVNTYKGSYSGASQFFNGITTDELYLTRAECYARQNNKDAALADLNTLLVKRWVSGTFTPYTAATADEALTFILQERRKELLYRGLRWSDLRRLNQDSKYAVILNRNLNGTTYTLMPNNARYVFPIPDLVIQLSGIEQNAR